MNPFIQVCLGVALVVPLVVAGARTKNTSNSTQMHSIVKETHSKPADMVRARRPSLTDPSAKHAKPLGKPMSFGVKGKWTVVNFWATWCGTCRRETPNIAALHEKYAPLGVQFVGVNLDTDRQAMTRYITEKKVKWPQVLTAHGWHSPVVSQYSIPSIPATYLVSPDGKVIEAGIRGFADGDRRISHHLK